MGLLDRLRRGSARPVRLAPRDDPAASPTSPSPTGASPTATRTSRERASATVEDAAASPTSSSPAPRVAPPLLRHSPFAFGFFGTIGAMLAYFLLLQVRSISSVLILIVIAMFLAIGLNPLVEWFRDRGARRGLAVLLVLAIVVGVISLFVVAIAPVISDQVALITKNAPGWLEVLQRNRTVQELDNRFDVISRVKEYIEGGSFGSSVFGGVLGVGLKVLSAITNTFIILVLTVYFLTSLPSIKEAGYRLAPASRRPRVRDLGDRILRSTGAYVGGAIVVAVFAGIGTLIFTFFVGLGEYSFALAFIVGLLSLIPVIGAFISGLVITALGLTISPTVALICLIYYLAYQQFEQYVIYPRIMARSVDLPGTITVVAALVGGSLLGITGAVLAVPFAAALVLLHKEIFLRRQDAR